MEILPISKPHTSSEVALSFSSHSVRPRFEPGSAHPHVDFPTFPELTPGECWDDSVLQASGAVLYWRLLFFNLKNKLRCYLSPDCAWYEANYIKSDTKICFTPKSLGVDGRCILLVSNLVYFPASTFHSNSHAHLNVHVSPSFYLRGQEHVSTGASLRMQGTEAGSDTGCLAPHHSYARGVHCFRQRVVLCKLDLYEYLQMRNSGLFRGLQQHTPAKWRYKTATCSNVVRRAAPGNLPANRHYNQWREFLSTQKPIRDKFRHQILAQPIKEPILATPEFVACGPMKVKRGERGVLPEWKVRGKREMTEKTRRPARFPLAKIRERLRQESNSLWSTRCLTPPGERCPIVSFDCDSRQPMITIVSTTRLVDDRNTARESGALHVKATRRWMRRVGRSHSAVHGSRTRAGWLGNSRGSVAAIISSDRPINPYLLFSHTSRLLKFASHGVQFVTSFSPISASIYAIMYSDVRPQLRRFVPASGYTVFASMDLPETLLEPARLLASHQGELNPRQDHSWIFACGNLGEHSRGSLVSPTRTFRRCSILTSFHPDRLSRPGCQEPPQSLSSTQIGKHPDLHGVLIAADNAVRMNRYYLWCSADGLVRKFLGTGTHLERPQWSSGQMTRPQPRRTGLDSLRGRSRIFACGNCAGRSRWSAGLLGDRPPLTSATLIGSQYLPVKSRRNLFTLPLLKPI
ncbi:hypothetical protein PR048_013808 [Dryococelus australis]|uniref:Uncharacterized protein n=1 Tax=Dryococelus australis TaxID=614101 RepID=A0ABQ9HTC4_9NEOP|nr:hypothetical protein PR048_013808 [Dryococelus australis]